MEDQDNAKTFKAPQLQDGLNLYIHPYNFHSQKILLILYEKKIDFSLYIVDLSQGEQYSSWFLNLNPKGDVPVLQDGCFVIPGSQQIINYLDEKYKQTNTKLLLKNFTTKERDRIAYFQQIINMLPIAAISLGSFIHDDLKLNPKAPFIGPVRSSCLKNNDKMHDLLKSLALKAEGNAGILTKKIEVQKLRKDLVTDRAEFQKFLDATKDVLDEVENELSSANTREWLISNEFSAADVSLGLLLYRLYSLGFENYFWTYGKLPHIESYFLRFRKRESFDKITPTSMTVLKDMWTRTPQNYKVGAGLVGMAMFAALNHK